MPFQRKRGFRRRRRAPRRIGQKTGDSRSMVTSTARPIANLAKGKGFWAGVARVAITAVRAAGEIKRYFMTGLYTLGSPALDLVGPDYAVGIWNIRILNEGIVQGDQQDQRQGNKIQVKGFKINYKITNNNSAANTARVMVVRMQKNFLKDTTPASTSPLPSGILGFPTYREVQVLYDDMVTLSASNTSADSMTRKVYRELSQPAHYPEDASSNPDKGSIFFCSAADNVQATSMAWNAELTYHNME